MVSSSSTTKLERWSRRALPRSLSDGHGHGPLNRVPAWCDSCVALVMLWMRGGAHRGRLHSSIFPAESYLARHSAAPSRVSHVAVPLARELRLSSLIHAVRSWRLRVGLGSKQQRMRARSADPCTMVRATWLAIRIARLLSCYCLPFGSSDHESSQELICNRVRDNIYSSTKIQTIYG